MLRNCFESISAFFHVVTARQEEERKDHPLPKVLPLHSHMKEKCLELYQPFVHLSIDEQMVNSKARSHFLQYICNKPTKWGFKYWVLADPSGYIVDFNLYCGARGQSISPNGLSYDVVMQLMQPFMFQGYQLFIDNFYTSPKLVIELHSLGIFTTGTLNTMRRGIPQDVQQLKTALKQRTVPRGTGYYFREQNSPIVYNCWQNKDCHPHVHSLPRT